MPGQTELLFHHIGRSVVLESIRNHKDVKCSPLFDMYSSDRTNELSLPIEWHAFGENLPPDMRIQTEPHITFKVNDIASTLREKGVIMPLYRPFASCCCAMIWANGALIELIETSLPEEEIWHDEATLRDDVLYGDQEGRLPPQEE